MTQKITIGNGYVELIDVLGSDASIAEAASISYGSVQDTPEKVRALIRKLMRNGHTSPFEMAEMIFKLKVPIYVWRQIVRHRTASINEASLRYTQLDTPDFENTSFWYFSGAVDRLNCDNVDQFCDNASSIESEAYKAAFDSYNKLLEMGVAKEQARKVLPVGTYTTAFWKMDLHNLMNFLRLRTSNKAQAETRQFAEAIKDFVRDKFPFTLEAFNDYVLNTNTFSWFECNALTRLLPNAIPDDFEYDEDMTESEITAFKEKIGRGTQTELNNFLDQIGTSEEDKKG